jgi:hypothetical protein
MSEKDESIDQRDGHAMDSGVGYLGQVPMGISRFVDGPTEIRTRVSAVRGQRPWPLDDGAVRACKIDSTYPLAPGQARRCTKPASIPTAGNSGAGI